MIVAAQSLRYGDLEKVTTTVCWLVAPATRPVAALEMVKGQAFIEKAAGHLVNAAALHFVRDNLALLTSLQCLRGNVCRVSLLYHLLHSEVRST